jgi:acyl-coenzyme A synthetase/AMP-(fatty) acid ligase
MPGLSNNAVVIDGETASWRARMDTAVHRYAGLEDRLRTSRALFTAGSAAEALEALVLGYVWHLDFAILDGARSSPELLADLEDQGFARVAGGVMQASCRPADPVPGRVSLFTSGTTGIPRLIEHRWETLNTLSRVHELPERFWFVPYQIGSYAWYQMMCLGMFSPAQHLFCAASDDPVSSFATALDHGVTAISSTPTFWRYALINLQADDLAKSQIQSITLGGEIVDQIILDQLRKIFPGAAIRHIYASTEAGAAIVVTDGRAGFPAERLQEDRIGLKIQDGKLFVRSVYTTAAASGESEAWIDTGDLVEKRDGRVFFLGREAGSLINVGGVKVRPSDIEGQLLAHPNVLWAKVIPRRAPLVGTVPAARVVLRKASSDPVEDEHELVSFLGGHLQEQAIPRSWEFIKEIPLSASQKS